MVRIFQKKYPEREKNQAQKVTVAPIIFRQNKYKMIKKRKKMVNFCID